MRVVWMCSPDTVRCSEARVNELGAVVFALPLWDRISFFLFYEWCLRTAVTSQPLAVNCQSPVMTGKPQLPSCNRQLL